MLIVSWAVGLCKREDTVDINTRANKVVKFDFCGTVNFREPVQCRTRRRLYTGRIKKKKTHTKKNQKTC